MLGPVFDARVDDWPKHLGHINRFWQSILLSAGNVVGNPMMKHLAIPTIGQEHFQQWLRLFYQTLHDIAPTPEAISHVGAKARMIAESMPTGIWVHRDRDDPLARKGELPDVGPPARPPRLSSPRSLSTQLSPDPVPITSLDLAGD